MSDDVKVKKGDDVKIPAPNSPESKYYDAFRKGGMKAVIESGRKK